MKNVIMFVLLAIVVSLNAQQVNPDEVLNKVKMKIDEIHDYSVDANVIVDVSFLKVPNSKAKIYFKQPDKMKMESDGFAMLPKQSFNFSPAMLLKENYTSVYAKDDTADGNDVYLIKVLPVSDSTDIILSNLWIDKAENIVRKIETSTKNAGTVTIELKYAEQTGYALPSELIISFKIEGVDLPSENGDAINQNHSGSWRNAKLSGTVTIQYENYEVNKGIPDEFFEEDNNN